MVPGKIPELQYTLRMTYCALSNLGDSLKTLKILGSLSVQRF